MPVLEVKGLCKSYGDTVAVDRISFDVKAGEIVGLLGPNGAGKTTTINMILGVLKPSGGSIFIGGKDVARERSRALARTNFAAVYAHVPGNLTVAQNLHIFGLLYGVRDLRNKIAESLKVFDLESFAHTKCGALSSGEQTRVALAKALINSPCALFLDEPTASLDPSSAEVIRDRMRQYASLGECGILWTSHNMFEVERVCDRVLFLSRGKILLQGDPRTLPAQQGKKNLEELFIALAREPLSVIDA